MAERGIEIKVGVLITVCLALLITFVLVLGDFSMSSGGEIYLDVETSAALKPGAPVKIAGVPSGKVTDVAYVGGAIDEKTGRPVNVRVTLRIDDDKLATLRRDARFYITTQGVLGEKYVEVEPHGNTGPRIAAGDVVSGEPPLRLEIMAMNANRVLSSLSEVLRNNEQNINDIIVNANDTMATVKRAVARADTLLASNSPKVSKVIDELLAIEAEVKTLAKAANNALGDGSELRGTIRDVSALSGALRGAVKPVVSDVRSTLGRYRDLADTGNSLLAEARKTAQSSLASVDDILDDVKAVSARIKDGQGTIGALLADKEMYDDIREMMKDLKRHPWKFIWKE